MIQRASHADGLDGIVETPSALFERITRELTTQVNGTQRRFADFSMPIPEEQYQDAARAFIEFLALPHAVKDKFHTFYDPREPKSHYGYERKSRQPVFENGVQIHPGGNKDNKEFIHYGRIVERELAAVINVPDRRVTRFFDAARAIYSPVEDATREFAQALDTKIPGTYSRWFPDDKLPQIYLRFLAYRPIKEGDPLANDHYDQAAGTFALWESKPGLYIGQGPTQEQPKLERIVHPVFHQPRKAHFFASAAIDQVIPAELLPLFPPGYHGVDHHGGEDSFDGTPRVAIVAFVWPAVGQFSAYDKVHPDPNRKFDEGYARSTNPDKC